MPKTIAVLNSITEDEKNNIRLKGIGGSDAPVVCGVNKYKSPMELWMEKTNKIKPKGAGEAAYWGNTLEPVILKEFERRTGLDVESEKTILQHDKYPFMIASLDGIAVDSKNKEAYILEIKTASEYKHNEWDEKIPDEYFIQVQHYMAVTGFKNAFVAALIGGNKYKHFLVSRDDELISMIIKIEESFWTHVINDKPVEIDGSRATELLLNRLYPIGMKRSIRLDEKALEYINIYEESKKEEVAILKRKTMAENKLKSMLGDYDKGFVNERIITWKTIESERINVSKLKNERLDIYNMYTDRNVYRRFGLQ